MHIALVVEHCHRRGGHERCVAEWATRLARRHQVSIVSQSLADVSSGTVAWKRVKAVLGPAPVAYLGFYLQAGAKARALRDAVVHTQGPNCPIFHVSSIHTVVRAKRDILKSSEAFRHELTRSQYLSWRFHYWLASRIELSLYPNPQGMLAPVSSGAAEEVTRYYGTAPSMISVVPNGVDLDAFKPGSAAERQRVLNSLGLDSANQYALFVGGEWARKGLPFALDVIEACSPKIHLLVAGNGPILFYKRLAAVRGVEHRVHFMGAVSDPTSLYRTGMVLLMPSLYEAFSLVSLEAAASGLPLLAAPVNGTAELIRNDENGWILPKDVTVWGEHMTVLGNDPGLAASMGRRSREITSQFTWDRAVRQFEKIYASVPS